MTKIILTEEQFKNLLSHEISGKAYVPLRKNRFPMNIFSGKLDEGLYKTYDISFVIKHFCDYLGVSSDYGEFARNVDSYNGFITKVSGENGEEYIEFVATDDPELIDAADKALKLCGYYKAFAEEYCRGYVQAGYEKRHDKPIILKTNRLYHITRRENLPRIKRDGLVPKAKNKKSYHLERIYFFTEDHGESGFKTLTEDLYGTHDSPFGYAVLEIDIAKAGNAVFHNDVNASGGVYTTDNIPPSAITVKYQYKGY